MEFIKLLKKTFSFKTAKETIEKQQLPNKNYLGEFEEESIHIKSTLEKQNFIEEIDPKIVLGECYDPIIKINSNNSFQQKKIFKKIITKTNLIQKNRNLNKCKHHFGYLNNRIRGADIPQECVICEKVIECMHFTD